MSWSYGPIASEVYDLAYPPGASIGDDVQAYLSVLADVGGPVLEPAVGAGRFLVPMLAAGHAVTGYDLSPDMLMICRRRLAEGGLSARVVEGDMTDWVEPEAYAAVVVPTGSIALLDGRTATLAALRSFAACLRPGGLLVFDVPMLPLLADPDELRIWRREDTVWTLQSMGVTADAGRNQTTRWLRYERWISGALDAAELMPWRLQHWSETEMRDLVAAAGLVQATTTGDHSRDAPGPASSMFTVACRAPG